MRTVFAAGESEESAVRVFAEDFIVPPWRSEQVWLPTGSSGSKSCRRHPLSCCGLGRMSWVAGSRTERRLQVDEKVSKRDGVRARVVELVTRAEAIVEALEG
ncbi:hypothetical protein GCM10009789_37770 [Kribbella sancticallisti]|uniref:Uncharacterized protein n=1 Tax=Kribbella sancticallisti TaxID=460087 RepID=A0ABP4PM82_9ACTN